MVSRKKRGGRRALANAARLFALAAALVAIGAPAAAEAAPAPYLAYLAPDMPGTSRITIDDDNVTGLSVRVYPTQCSFGGGAPSGHSFVLSLPAGPVAMIDGAFHIQGTAPSLYYSGTADFVLDGQLTPDRRSISATITLSNAHDAFITGCSGSVSLLALPESADVSNTWGVPQDRSFVSSTVSFDYSGGLLKRLTVEANFLCGTGVDAAEIIADLYGITSIPVTGSGDFSLHAYVFDEYEAIMVFDMTGHIAGSTASGMISIGSPPGFTGSFGKPCSGNYSWSAKPPTTPVTVTPPVVPTSPVSPAPVVPAPPAAPVKRSGPEATFEWNAVRVPRGASYQYFFYITELKCSKGANAVRIRVASRTLQVACRKRAGWASGPLTPSTPYKTTAQAVKIRRHKIIKRGVIVQGSQTMPAEDEDWAPISKLPGSPPH